MRHVKPAPTDTITVVATQAIAQAIANALQSDEVQIALRSFCDGRRLKGQWAIHLNGLEIVNGKAGQGLKVVGLELRNG